MAFFWCCIYTDTGTTYFFVNIEFFSNIVTYTHSFNFLPFYWLIMSVNRSVSSPYLSNRVRWALALFQVIFLWSQLSFDFCFVLSCRLKACLNDFNFYEFNYMDYLRLCLEWIICKKRNKVNSHTIILLLFLLKLILLSKKLNSFTYYSSNHDN